MATRWSWNINGQAVPNWEQLIAWGQEAKPTWTLVMDNWAKAREWKDRVGGEVTYRVWDQRDNYYHHDVKAVDAAEAMARENDGLQDMWQYYRLNEPGGDWPHLQRWIIDFAEAARKRGFKSTAHGLAILKNWPDPEWVAAGNCDDLIIYAYEHQDTFILNIHDYVTGFAWSSHTPDYPRNLFDRALSLWGEQNAKASWTQYRPSITSWYLNRVVWVTNIRAKTLVGEAIPYIIDEALFDWHASVHNQQVVVNGVRSEVANLLRWEYGDDRYNRDIRGVLGSRRLFAWLAKGNANAPFSDEEFSDVILRNFVWAEANIPPNCKSIQLFTMNPDWREPEGHDYIPIANALLPRMTAGLKLKPPDSGGGTTMLERRIRVTGSQVRVRSIPGLNGTFVGWFTATEYTSALVGEAVTEQDGYAWRQIEVGPLKGWSAFDVLSTGVKLIEIEPVAEPEPEPPTFSEDELALIAAYRAQDFRTIYDLSQEFVQFKDIAFGEYTVAIPEPLMDVLGNVCIGLGNFLKDDG